MYHLSESQEDPLLIKDDSILESIDECSIKGLNSVRHPHQLVDPGQEEVKWTSIYDHDTPESLSSPQNQHTQEKLRPNLTFTSKLQDLNNISIIEEEYYPTPRSLNTVSSSVSHQNVNQDNTEIIQDFIRYSSNSSQSSSTIDPDSTGNSDNIDEIKDIDIITTREIQISSNIDKNNILPENKKRTYKAPRRDILALASNYKTFHLAMAATVSNPIIIG
ncbi:hypothetical protein GcM1_239128 [Golovinomyces cichoracearum]|uniref:Uncharacterized protein n=1 Tax=Golovinomyces cichoracearum TaxID=62708 RepID=A0A420IJ49_9PEZI|nr:hypothetical protein GcM1_239128 [Golovinomyces cichoracearum]